MNKRIFTNALILALCLLLTSCMERTGPYTDDEQDFIALICNTDWATEITTYPDGNTWQGVYQFKRDATYRRTLINTTPEGEVKTSYITGIWSFTDRSHGCISFNSGDYWDLDIVSKEKFAFYLRSGEWDDPSMTREYTVLTPYEGTNLP